MGGWGALSAPVALAAVVRIQNDDAGIDVRALLRTMR